MASLRALSTVFHKMVKQGQTYMLGVLHVMLNFLNAITKSVNELVLN